MINENERLPVFDEDDDKWLSHEPVIAWSHEVEIPKPADKPVIVWAYGEESDPTQEEIESLSGKFKGLKLVLQEAKWQSTADEKRDRDANAAIWEELAADSFGGGRAIIVGMFPPVAIESLETADFSHCVGPEVWTPVYDDRDTMYPARWAQIAGMA